MVQKKWLQFELHRWYGRKNTNSRLLTLIHLKLSSRLLDFELYEVLLETDSACHRQRQVLKYRKEKKLTTLRLTQQPPTYAHPESPTFYPPCVNLSTVTFNEAESKLLEKGLKFGLPPSQPSRTTDFLVTDLMVGLKNNQAAVEKCTKMIKANSVITGA